MKKIVCIALIAISSTVVASQENDWDIVDPAQKRNIAAHSIAHEVEKYFGATCRALRAATIWYLCGDVLLGEPACMDNAPTPWRIARNFDMSWVGIPANMPVDFFMGTRDILPRIAAGYGVAAVVYSAHELGHALARYYLTGVKSTIAIGSSWSATLGLLKEGEKKPAPLCTLAHGRFIIRGSCINCGVSNPDVDTERIGNRPTGKGLIIALAGGIAGILATKTIKGLSYLVRHQKDFKKNRMATIKQALWHCCTLDNCTLFNLYNMLYPLYGLDSYYLWWYSAYVAQKDPGQQPAGPESSIAATK